MRISKLIFGMVALLAMSLATACSQKELDGPDDPNNAGNAYMTLRLAGSQNSPASRTEPGNDNPATNEGTKEEGTITSALVMLCDPSQKVQHSYTLTLAKGDYSATTDGVITKPFKVTSGTFEVFVIANPPAALAAKVAVGTDLKGVKMSSIVEALMKSDYANDDNFVMFNECNGSDDLKGVGIEIKPENDYTHPATCNDIKLDRLACKIKSQYGTKDTPAIITSLQAEANFCTAVNLVGFKLLNGLTEVNLQQKWISPKGSVPAAGSTSGAKWSNLLQTMVFGAGDNATTPEGYYNHLNLFRIVEEEAGTSKYLTAQDNYDVVPYYMGDTKKTDPIYAMENSPTCDERGALRGNTTGLVYQFQCTVGESDGKAGDNCFYGYAGKYYKSLADIETAYPGMFAKINGTGVSSAQTELEAAYLAGQKAISDFRVKYNIKVYTDGIMYYVHYIKDKNYENQEGERYYSVMRNTIYDLTVTELVRIGTDIPGGWYPGTNPNDPVDDKSTYMIVRVRVNPWVLSTEDITLK